MNIENIKKNITTTKITFLVDIDKTIDINKNNKAYYYKIIGINLDQIKNFLYNIRDHDVILINPFVSVTCTLNNPILTLSRQFLVTNKSSPNIIYL